MSRKSPYPLNNPEPRQRRQVLAIGAEDVVEAGGHGAREIARRARAVSSLVFLVFIRVIILDPPVIDGHSALPKVEAELAAGEVRLM